MKRAVLIGLMVASAHMVAFGCLCPPISFDDQISRADVVIVGKIISSDDAVSAENKFYDGERTSPRPSACTKS